MLSILSCVSWQSVYLLCVICLYCFAFAICPRVLTVRFVCLFLTIVFTACYPWWFLIPFVMSIFGVRLFLIPFVMCALWSEVVSHPLWDVGPVV